MTTRRFIPEDGNIRKYYRENIKQQTFPLYSQIPRENKQQIFPLYSQIPRENINKQTFPLY
jgi:hypothetical protein